MSLLKVCRVYVKRPNVDNGDVNASPSSVLLENRYQEGAVLFESGAVTCLSPGDISTRKSHYIKFLDAYACIGVIQSPTSTGIDSVGNITVSYLIMVTGCTIIGRLPDHEVFRITNVQFVSLSTSGSEEELSDVRKLLCSGWFYYARSPGSGAHFDLTLNIQDRYKLNSVIQKDQNLYARTDMGFDFLWNIGLLTPFLQWSVNPLDWVVPIICGSFELSTVYCGADQARIGIISRLSTRRPGTRFQARGINDNGDVANFVETEQFIYLDKSVASFVQLRGTVPLFWNQPGLQVGSHKITMRRVVQQSINAFERHFVKILSHYGSTAVVNLLGCKKGEKMLGQAFQEAHDRSAFKSDVPHLVFDYHSEVQTHGEKSLDWLKRRLNQWVSQWGFFHYRDGHVEQYQSGVLRVNCVDCLDRTNSVQTMVGLQLILPQMLNQLIVVSVNQSIMRNRFVDSLRQVWQLNGDHISRIYAGTGALGSGRSRFKDVQRSAVRSIQQNFFDSAKHAAMHLMLVNCSIHGWMRYYIGQYIPRRLHYFPPQLLTTLMSRHEEFSEKHPLRLFIGTWNVNGGKYFRSVAHKQSSVSDWLLDLYNTVDVEANWGFLNPHYANASLPKSHSLERPVDIFAIGFQEIVDLTTSNIMTSSKASRNQRDWGVFLQRHLNQNQHPRDTYLLISSVQLVGVCLYLFVRARLAYHLRDISTASVKTGLRGATGNKGGVAIRFQLGATSVCIVCSHFAAGQSAVRERNDDFNEIFRRLSLLDGRSLMSHDYVFWCGDFNYRVNLPANDVKCLVSQRDWPVLLTNDQLTQERKAGNVFRGFNEGPIKFAPTYKYDQFCDDYDTSEKARSPAWTDRVLWRQTPLQFPTLDKNGILVYEPQQNSENCSQPVRLVVYNRCELRTSDHRPVGAIFDVDFSVISRNERRRVLLDMIDKYGDFSSSVLLTMCLVECQTQQLVSDEIANEAVYRLFDFLEDLKTLATVKHSVVRSVYRLDFNQFVIIYSNARQASQAAVELNGCVTGYTTGLLPFIAGGYEFHFSACLYASTVGIDNSEKVKQLIEVSERDDAQIHGPPLSVDVFEALPPDKTEGVDNETRGDTFIFATESDDDDQYGLDDISNMDALAVANDHSDLIRKVISATTPPARKAPPRPAPPITCAPLGQQGLISPNNESIRPTWLASTHTSPVHARRPNSHADNGDLLQRIVGSDRPMNSSCVDLFSSGQHSSAGLLITNTDEIIAQRTCSSASLFNMWTSTVPPTASAKQTLCPQDPFSLVDHSSENTHITTTTANSDPPAALIDLENPLPSRRVPPPLPPRPAGFSGSGS